ALELVLEVREHLPDRAALVALATEHPVRGGERLVDAERRLGVVERAHFVAVHLVGDGELEMRARQGDFVVDHAGGSAVAPPGGKAGDDERSPRSNGVGTAMLGTFGARSASGRSAGFSPAAVCSV